MKVKLILKIIVLFSLLTCSNYAFGQTEEIADKRNFLTGVQISEADKIKVFENCWQTVNRLYFDAGFNGTDWLRQRETYLPQAVAAKDKIELIRILNNMLGEIKTSHLSVSFEIGMSGKTLKKYFGEKFNFSQNDIIYEYGFSTAKLDGRTIVTTVEKNSSADESGIKPGWIIKSFKLEPQSIRQGDFIIHSETGNYTFVTESGEERNLTLNKSFYLKPRSAIQRVSKIFEGDILYLKFNSFDKGIGKWISTRIAANPDAKAIIIDLRDNFGGLVDEVKESLSSFFPEKTVIGNFTERDSDNKTFRVGSKDSYNGKVVALIDENSSSGAEVFAAALQESGRGKIIGQKSSGQVLFGITKNLSNGLKLYVAIRDYKTSKGVRLEGKGVTPDVEIPFTLEDFRQQRDIVLKKALEILSS